MPTSWPQWHVRHAADYLIVRIGAWTYRIGLSVGRTLVAHEWASIIAWTKRFVCIYTECINCAQKPQQPQQQQRTPITRCVVDGKRNRFDTVSDSYRIERFAPRDCIKVNAHNRFLLFYDSNLCRIHLSRRVAVSSMEIRVHPERMIRWYLHLVILTTIELGSLGY